MTLLIGEGARLGFVPIFHFPVPHALFPLPVLETSPLQVLVLFKTVQSSWFFARHAHLLVQVSDIKITITKESQSHENDIIPCHTG